ncbi:MAG: hypothetical protein AABX93_03390, partial [Nanoarchaeota archaeon]
MRKRGIEVLFGILILGVFFMGNVSAGGINVSDSFLTPGATALTGLATNGSDFWIADYTDDFLHHYIRNGTNQTDGFSLTTIAPAPTPSGIIRNGSDFWITDETSDFVSHISKTGINQTDGFSILAIGSTSSNGITTNITSGRPTDFWIVDYTNDFLYHINRTGGNYTSAGPVSSVNAIGEPGFSIGSAGSGLSSGLVTNNSDFWVVDFSDNFVYHFNRNGVNQSDGFSILSTLVPGDLATNITSGRPTDFWITDRDSGGVYHFLEDSISPSINITFPFSNNTFTSNVDLDVNFTFSDNLAYSSCWYSNDTYSVNTSSTSNLWRSVTGGFGLATSGAANEASLTKNASDFWVLDGIDAAVYHYNRTGGNISGSFSTSAAGASNPLGITTNVSDFWVVDFGDDFVYHFNKTGGNVSGGFSIASAGSDLGVGIVTNNSDFWVVDSGDDFIYHFNRTGGNQSDGFEISSAGATTPADIAINISSGTPTDFWIGDSDLWVYHFDRTGGNISDGFSTSVATSSNAPNGLATNTTNFWFAEGGSTDFIFHLYKTKTTLNLTEISWSEGNHNVTIYCNDSANNLNWGTISFTIDTINPSINITSPSQNNTNSGDSNLDIEYVIVEANPDTCWYSNDTYSKNTTITCGQNITSVFWTQGYHNLTIWINDSVGNRNSTSRSFTILDDIPPNINIIFPSNTSQTANTGLDVNYTASDAGVGLSSCWYSNDTYSVNTTITCGQNLTSITWSDALHNVTVWANDILGNVNSSSVSFTVKSSAPDTNYASPTESSGVFKSRNYILVNVTAVDSSLDSVYIRLYDSSMNLINFSLTETSPNFVNFSGLSEGIYYYNA